MWAQGTFKQRYIEMIETFIAYTDDPDSTDAVEEVLGELENQLDGRIPSAALLFCGIDYEHQELLDAINRCYPGIALIGATTCGEIACGMGFERDSLVLTLFVSDTVEFAAGVGRGLSNDIALATATAVEDARAQIRKAPGLCITFPESLTASGSEITEGLNRVLDIPVIGGTAGDYVRFKQTYQFFNGEVLSDSIPVLLLGGEIHYGYGFSCGWQPVGERGTVTKVEGDMVFEIDHKPATDFYLRYIPNLERPTEYPIAIFDSTDSDYFYLRSPVSANHETGSIHFFGDVPYGATVQCTISDTEQVLRATQDAVNSAKSMFGNGKPALMLLFSCGGRAMYLGPRTSKEYEYAIDELDNDDPQVAGFYSYGEIVPLRAGEKSFFHNVTIIALLLG